MILVDEKADHFEAADASRRARPLEIDGAWRDDVVLEIWIDITSDPVRIRLAGILNASTGANLLGLVEECMADGRLHFELDTGALHPEDSGLTVLRRIEERLTLAGGRMVPKWRAPA